MFLAKPGEYEPCGMFSLGHLILAISTIIMIVVALKSSIHKEKEEIKNIIKKCTITVWIFELIKIAFSLSVGSLRDVNTYVPLYYCSLLLYAGLLSSFGKGKFKRVGDVFLATGGIVGGLVFLIFPSTSIVTYPMLHFLSLHSFVFHGIMIYLSLLINIINYIELERKDSIYYASLVGIFCILAYIVNCNFESNLMFISQSFPIKPIEFLYNNTGRFFTIVMSIVQMTVPFIIVYAIRKIKLPYKKNN